MLDENTTHAQTGGIHLPQYSDPHTYTNTKIHNILTSMYTYTRQGEYEFSEDKRHVSKSPIIYAGTFVQVRQRCAWCHAQTIAGWCGGVCNTA